MFKAKTHRPLLDCYKKILLNRCKRRCLPVWGQRFSTFHSVVPGDIAILRGVFQRTAGTALVQTLLTVPSAFRWYFIISHSIICDRIMVMSLLMGVNLWLMCVLYVCIRKCSSKTHLWSRSIWRISSWIYPWQSPGKPLFLELPLHGFLYAATTEGQMHNTL